MADGDSPGKGYKETKDVVLVCVGVSTMKSGKGVVMTRNGFAALLLGAATLCLSTVALAQAGPDIGKREYDSNCAACHGPKGTGDGPFVDLMYLGKRLPDLTTLAKRNNGVFPTARVYEIIDGRQEIKGHGPRDMPIWGRDYLEKMGDTFAVYPYDPEPIVRVRILALVDYIARLQAK
jgi:mono/diheme cytochrome c family protein